MKYVFIVQCGNAILLCAGTASFAYESLAKQLPASQQSYLISYMSLTRLFKRDAIYCLAIPMAMTWYIKKLPVHKKGDIPVITNG